MVSEIGSCSCSYKNQLIVFNPHLSNTDPVQRTDHVQGKLKRMVAMFVCICHSTCTKFWSLNKHSTVSYFHPSLRKLHAHTQTHLDTNTHVYMHTHTVYTYHAPSNIHINMKIHTCWMCFGSYQGRIFNIHCFTQRSGGVCIDSFSFSRLRLLVDFDLGIN